MDKYYKFIEALETIAPSGLIVNNNSINYYYLKYHPTPFIQIICNDIQDDGKGWREFRIESVDEQEVLFRRYSQYVRIKIEDCPLSIRCFALLIYLNRYIEEMKTALKKDGFIHQEDYVSISNIFEMVGYADGATNFSKEVKYDDLVEIRRQCKENNIDANLLFSCMKELQKKKQQEIRQQIRQRELEYEKKKAEAELIKVKRESMKNSIEYANEVLLSFNREKLNYTEDNLEEVYEVAVKHLAKLNILILKNKSNSLDTNKSFFA